MELNSYYSLTILIVTIISPLIGSFLNVVIYRLPIILENSWRRDCLDFLKEDKLLFKSLDLDKKKLNIVIPNEKINLSFPNSFCPKCKIQIKFYDNIPILSYLILGGKCRTCESNIPFMYLFIEIITLFLSLIIAIKFGFSLKTLSGLFLIWPLIAASAIDYKHYILPDNIIIPLLWLGLIINSYNIIIDLNLAVFSAIISYVIFWIIAKLYFIISNKEGIGYGDFKLYALFGAWLGIYMIPQIIIISSFLAIIVAVLTKVTYNRKLLDNPIPYGPFIAIAGYIALLYGKEINNWYINLLIG